MLHSGKLALGSDGHNEAHTEDKYIQKSFRAATNADDHLTC